MRPNDVNQTYSEVSMGYPVTMRAESIKSSYPAFPFHFYRCSQSRSLPEPESLTREKPAAKNTPCENCADEKAHGIHVFFIEGIIRISNHNDRRKKRKIAIQIQLTVCQMCPLNMFTVVTFVIVPHIAEKENPNVNLLEQTTIIIIASQQ